MKKMLEMLTYRRPAGSAGEKAFIDRYIMPLKPEIYERNLIITVPGDEDTLFSCHTDTVHRDDKRQVVLHDATLNIAYKDDKEPLGGDNTAGVWLLLEMIKAKIPGTYMFHYGEERGCIGSKAMAHAWPEWLATFKRAIAFDRRGNTSIITHQMSERCCSDAFGDELARQLGNDYKRDDTGLYTDTASYMRLIPECSNVSVGYDHEHRPEELVDLGHLLWLRDAVKLVRWSELPTSRDPSVVEFDDEYDTFDYKNWFKHTKSKSITDDYDYLIDTAYAEIHDFESAEELVRLEPTLAAEILVALMFDQGVRESDDIVVDPETVELDDAIRALGRSRTPALN